MEDTLYEPVSNKDVTIVKSQITEKSSWKPLLRQVLICSGVWSSFFITGISLGGPTVIIPQLRKEANSTDAVSVEMASWISSIHGYASLPWFILPIMSCWIGRKYPFFIVNIMSLVSFTVLYCSVTNIQILIAVSLQGPLFASASTIAVMIIIEYSSPKHRGLFLTLKSATMNWGIWVANALGTFFHWKYVAVAGIVCSIYNILLLLLIMCESPSWLAFKNRYEECVRNHRWIKGEDAESEKELEALIKSCKDYHIKQDKVKAEQTSILSRLYKTTLEKGFYEPLLLSAGILSLYHTSGKLVCSVYAIDIIKNITFNESTAYIGMLLLDAITVIGMYVGSGLTKCLNRRTLLFTGSFGGVFFLFVLSLYLYLIKLTLITENKYVSLSILTLFFLFISIGPIILSSSIYGEIVPMRYRSLGMILVGFYSQIILSTTLKTAPLIFRTFELYGAFLFYATLSIVIIIFVYKFLPETKDKTLLEIEEHFNGPLDPKESKETEPLYNK